MLTEPIRAAIVISGVVAALFVFTMRITESAKEALIILITALSIITALLGVTLWVAEG